MKNHHEELSSTIKSKVIRFFAVVLKPFYADVMQAKTPNMRYKIFLYIYIYIYKGRRCFSSSESDMISIKLQNKHIPTQRQNDATYTIVITHKMMKLLQTRHLITYGNSQYYNDALRMAMKIIHSIIIPMKNTSIRHVLILSHTKNQVFCQTNSSSCNHANLQALFK